MATNELEMFVAAWDREAASTVKLLQALPATQYDFRSRPDNSVFQRPHDHSRHHVEFHHGSRDSPSRPAHLDVPPCRR